MKKEHIKKIVSTLAKPLLAAGLSLCTLLGCGEKKLVPTDLVDIVVQGAESKVTYLSSNKFVFGNTEISTHEGHGFLQGSKCGYFKITLDYDALKTVSTKEKDVLDRFKHKAIPVLIVEYHPAFEYANQNIIINNELRSGHNTRICLADELADESPEHGLFIRISDKKQAYVQDAKKLNEWYRIIFNTVKKEYTGEGIGKEDRKQIMDMLDEIDKAICDANNEKYENRFKEK